MKLRILYVFLIVSSLPLEGGIFSYFASQWTALQTKFSDSAEIKAEKKQAKFISSLQEIANKTKNDYKKDVFEPFLETMPNDLMYELSKQREKFLEQRTKQLIEENIDGVSQSEAPSNGNREAKIRNVIDKHELKDLGKVENDKPRFCIYYSGNVTKNDGRMFVRIDLVERLLCTDRMKDRGTKQWEDVTIEKKKIHYSALVSENKKGELEWKYINLNNQAEQNATAWYSRLWSVFSRGSKKRLVFNSNQLEQLRSAPRWNYSERDCPGKTASLEYNPAQDSALDEQEKNKYWLK